MNDHTNAPAAFVAILMILILGSVGLVMLEVVQNLINVLTWGMAL